jgi:hypothetical protein
MPFTAVCAGLALLVLGICLVYGMGHRLRWTRAQRELLSVRQGLAQEFGLRSHRQLYASSEELLAVLLDQALTAPQARIVADELISPVRDYHSRAMAGGSAAWEEIRDAFLERQRLPIRAVRSAAGWVVLLGLAGTVLGFGTAMPSLRSVLASQGNTASTVATVHTGFATDSAGSAGQRLSKVLDSLEGVFTATFAGVVSSLLLSVFVLLILEPTFGRFAQQVDLLGARWFVPLIHAPDTLVDDALRNELRIYFDRIGERLDAVLHPLIQRLSISLEKMSGLAIDFSGNIRVGVSTLETFREAVARLGGSAEGAVDQLVKIVRLSTDFVRELETLQAEGAKTLAVPAEKLVESAATIATRMTALDGRLGSLENASRDTVKVLAITQAAIGGLPAAVRESLMPLAESPGKAIEVGFASLPAVVREAAGPLLERHAKTISAGQDRSARASLDALAELTACVGRLDRLLTAPPVSPSDDEGNHALSLGIEKLNAWLAEWPQLIADAQRRLAETLARNQEPLVRDLRATALAGLSPGTLQRSVPPPKSTIAARLLRWLRRRRGPKRA